jgi:very-short-patch-repair endonuclease
MRQILAERGPGYVPAESNLERRFAQILEGTGIPMPRRQVGVEASGRVGRIDFMWTDLRGGIEVQSSRFHSSFLDRRHDERRTSWLLEQGVDVLEVWDRDIFHRPIDVVGRVRQFRWWLEGLVDERPN